ncbi:MAG: helix-turn-helix transcriptional regulator [Planctomycetota bacterium]
MSSKSPAPIDGVQLRGRLETMALAVLEEGEAHGFEVLRRLEARGCGLLKLREGSLYPALYRLEERGLLKARWEDNPGGRKGPARKTYRLTPKGRRQLQAGREEWATFVTVIGGIVGAPE